MGTTCSIADPAKLGLTVRATDMLLGWDANSLRFLNYFRAADKLCAAEAEKTAKK